eukprot:g1868.t1
MFEKTLQDLVKGIRANKKNPRKYIAKCIAETKTEIRTTDPNLKAQAVSKLVYLHLLGHDVGWAAFHIVEVMSQVLFRHKRIGYLAAEQCFTADTDVILLCTNLLKKELNSKNQYAVGLAINCLSNIATKEISRVLLGDIVAMLSSPRPYIRKKAVLVLFKIFLKYPQGLRLTFDRLQDKLKDDDPSVVSSAVNVICELSRKKPKNYLALAPQLYKLLTSSTNNWMLIKVVKLLGELVPEEPRLARKIMDPLVKLIRKTRAKSLLYECLKTVTLSLPYMTRNKDGRQAKSVPGIVDLCMSKFREFIEDEDQNLKYLGLVGLVSLMRFSRDVVLEHKSLVLECLNDEDVTIRVQALELVTGMITRRNIKVIVRKLSLSMESAEGHYRDELVSKIIAICSRDKYADVTDFAWYVGVLKDLANTKSSQFEEKIAQQLMDVTLRVPSVRAFAVKSLQPVLTDSGAGGRGGEHILAAAAWIIGEYANNLTHPMSAMQVLVKPASVLERSASTQGIFLNAALKIAAAFDRPDLWGVLVERITHFETSAHVNVQERALTIRAICRCVCSDRDDVDGESSKNGMEAADNILDIEVGVGETKNHGTTKMGSELLRTLRSIFSAKLAPVSERAQRKVPIPADLDLDAKINTDVSVFEEATDDGTDPERKRIDVVSFCEPVEEVDDDEEEDDDDDDDDDSEIYKVLGKTTKHRDNRTKSGRGEDWRRSTETTTEEEVEEEEEERRRKKARQRRRRRRKNDPFYLSSNASDPEDDEDAADLLNVSDIPIKKFEEGVLRDLDDDAADDDDDDDDDDGGSDLSGDSRRRKQKMIQYEVLRDEIMPEGAAVDDDDDDEDSTIRSGRVPSEDTPNDNDGDDDDSDQNLEDIDITKPLAPGELEMPTLKHRVVPDKDVATSGVGRDRRQSEKKKKKKSKKKKKKKKKKSRDRKKKEKEEGSLFGDDLLGLGDNAPSSAKEKPRRSRSKRDGKKRRSKKDPGASNDLDSLLGLSF